MREHCAQCLTVLPKGGNRYVAPSDDILCAPCYYALWGRNGLRTRQNGNGAAKPAWLKGRPSSTAR